MNAEESKERYSRQAVLCPNNFLLTALNIANHCDINYKMAKNKRLHVEMALIKMAYIGSAVRLATGEIESPDGRHVRRLRV